MFLPFLFHLFSPLFQMCLCNVFAAYSIRVLQTGCLFPRLFSIFPPLLSLFLCTYFAAGGDAFLLEPILRADLWNFMGEPVSEDNERAVCTTMAEVSACQLPPHFFFS